MVRAYEVHAADDAWNQGGRFQIEAIHARKLPGVRCPNCGSWAMTGVLYPSIDVASIDAAIDTVGPWPVSVEDFHRIRERIQPVLGVARPAEPGADLGPLRGNANGPCDDFAWVNPWTLLVRESVFSALSEAGIELLGIPAQLDWNSNSDETLVELEALPKAKLANVEVPESCVICGRVAVKRPDRLMIDSASFDDSIWLQRVVELPTVLVANETLAQFIGTNLLRGVRLTPLALS
jgi:uncharacterized double-CXXCG motif protein